MTSLEYLQLTPIQLEKHRQKLVSFIQQHGDNRITHRAVRWVKSLDPDATLLNPGTSAIAAMDDKRLRGFLIVSDYGRDESFVVVHRDYRSMNTGKNLIQQYLYHHDKLYGRVALDNIPSLKMCLANGMVGFKMTEGPTGKPTLWLGIGNWNKDDIE